MDWQALLNSVIEWATSAGIKLVIALLILFISFKIVNFVARRIEKAAEKKNVDKTIMRTLAYLIKVGLKIVIAVCLVGYVGIDTSGLAALVTSLGVCVGLAVNGALSNLAGGVLIILTRPFRIDDYIEAQGYSGTVVDIHITNTVLRTPDNKIVYIPNGALSADTIVNYSVEETRRVDVSFAIAYSADYEKARAIITEICVEHPLVLEDPAPFVRMTEHAASSITVTARVWTKSADFWTVKFDLMETVKARFDAEGIEIPFDQLDVHIKNS